MTVTANIGLTFIKSVELCAKYFTGWLGKENCRVSLNLQNHHLLEFVSTNVSLIDLLLMGGHVKGPAGGLPAPGEWVVVLHFLKDSFDIR